MLRRLTRSSSARIGMIIVICLVLAAVFASILTPFEPAQMRAGPRYSPPSLAHPFGTDQFGRDMLTRVLHGARLTLVIGAIAVSISMVIGVLIGLFGGYNKGILGNLLMRGIDVLFSFPDTLIALAAVAVLGPSLQNAMIAVGISTIPVYARIAYSAVVVESGKEYMAAGRAISASTARLVFRHLLPNILPPMIVVGTLGVSTAILAAAGLSFLGLGAQPPTPEWGAMLAEGRNAFSRAPWLSAFPGIAIAITVLGFNLLGDGLREALDPTQRRVLQ
ncbi:ABC transporter permease [Hoeflea prorocentri]|nr:ABC transporter permease [Hoeflea prorocentri]MCY6381915.1 ABC transporter permease [Hoeflea prorocentri]